MKSSSFFLLCFLVAFAQPSSGQGEGRHKFVLSVGVAEEGSGAALGEALVEVLPAGRRVRSDAIGRATIAGLDSGSYEVHVLRLGYKPLSTAIRLATFDTVEAVFFLNRAVAELEANVTTAQRTAPFLVAGAADFERRRQLGVGDFLSSAQIDSVHAPGQRLVEFLMERFTGMHAYWDQSLISVNLFSTRGAVSLMSGTCAVRVFLDGLPASGADIGALHTSDVAGVEYYESGGPPEYRAPGTQCGLLLLWRRR
jgi:hypothetical protein